VATMRLKRYINTPHPTYASVVSETIPRFFFKDDWWREHYLIYIRHWLKWEGGMAGRDNIDYETCRMQMQID
jgi:hypothetical protein